MAGMSRVARRGVRSVAVAVTPMAVMACLSPLAQGQQLWWDANGVNSGIGGGGTWNTTSSLWSPDATGIRLVGAPPVSNAVVWSNTGAGTATFAGSSGTVDVVGTVTAAGMVISTTGYRFRGSGPLQLGNPSAASAFDRIGFINLSPGVTATFSGRLTTTPSSDFSISVNGLGRVILDSASVLMDNNLRARNGASVRVTHPNAATDGFFEIREGSRLDFGSLSSASVGTIFCANTATIDLGSTLVTLRQTSGSPSLFGGELTSTASGGLILSTQSSAPTSFPALTLSGVTTIGTLHLLVGTPTAFALSSSTSLVSMGDSSTGGRPSLLVGPGTTAQVLDSAVVSAFGFPEVQPTGQISVSESGRLNIRGANSALRIGSTGTATVSIGTVLVSGSSASILADNDIVLGTTAPVNPGIGELRVDTGATVTARRIVMNNGLLGLSTSASVTVETLVNNGGNIRLGESSTLTFTGNTTHTLAGTLQNNDTGFGGLLKVNAGTLIVPESLGGFFNGTVRTGPNATLFPTRASLQTATVHLEPGSILNLSQLVPSDAFRIGALAGDNPLTLSNRFLEFAASGTSATYSGRLATSGVRKIGSGTQTFTGGTVAEPITSPFLTVSAGTLRLSGAHVTLTSTNTLSSVEGPLTTSNPDTLLLVDSGSQFTTFTRPRVSTNSTLRVSGTGTAFSIVRGITNEAAILVGSNGGGKLEVLDGAAFSANGILLGASNQGPEVVSSARVAGGAQLNLSEFLQFESPFSTFTVDNATATVSAIYHRTPTGGGNLVLSDPAGGAHALVVGLTANPFGIEYFGNIADGPSGPGSIRFLGNVVRAWNPATNTLTGRLTVDAGTMRISNSAVFAPNILEVNTPSALDVSTITDRPNKNLSIGHLAGSADFNPLNFNDLILGRNASTFDAPAYSGHLTTSATQRIFKFGSSIQSFAGATIDTPSLLVVQGTVILSNATTANLTATGSTGFAGNSSLFVEGGSTLQIAQNSVVNAVGSVQVHNSGFLFINSGGSLVVNRSGDVRAQLRIGYAGGTSLMSITSGASVTSQDSVEVGSQYAPNPGIGRLNVSNATLTAPVLNFNNSASEVNLSANPAIGGPTTLNIATIFSDPLAPNTSFTLSGSSTVNLIDPARFPMTSAFTLPTSTYTGRITGLGTINTSVPLLDLALAPTMAGAINVTAGTLRIRNSGTLTTIGPTINLTGGTLDLGVPNVIRTITSTSAVFGAGGGLIIDLASSSGATSLITDGLLLNSLLALTATPDDPFIISIRSLSAIGTPGPLTNFNPAAPFDFGIVFATGGVAVLNPNATLIDTTGFQNAYAGTFSIRVDPGSLRLVYTPGVIPEPASLSLLALPALALTRRRRRSGPTKSPSSPRCNACTPGRDGPGSSHVSEPHHFNE